MVRYARFGVALAIAAVTAVVYPAVTPKAPSAAQVTASDQSTVSIMPLGDSITGSTGCWREVLWNKLVDAGYTGIDFVGHRPGPSCDGSGYDSDSNGISGTLVSELGESGELIDWLSQDYPDVVLMHYGSNDIRHGKNTDDILEGMSLALGQMRQVNPNVIVLVAQVIPMNTTPMHKECPSCPDKVDELNQAIPTWVTNHNTEASPVRAVDQSIGFDPDVDTYDGLHSDSSGAKKIANAWFTALTQVL